MPRRNHTARNRRGRPRGLRALKPGESRCKYCMAISGANGGRPNHQTGCPERGNR